MEYRRVTLQRLAAMAFAEALMEAKSVRAGACVGSGLNAKSADSA